MGKRKLKKTMSFIGVFISTLLGGCGATPSNNDIVGLWVSSDGAELSFDLDGQFSAHSIPQNLFFRPDQTGRVDGKGNWSLEKGGSYWEVKMSFKEIAGQVDGYSTSILISGRGASLYLYQWQEEEGGSRYKFKASRKKNAQD